MCYLQLRQLRVIRRSLQPEVIRMLLHAFVACRLDSCNSLMFVLLACDINRLQSVQNAAAQLLGGIFIATMSLQYNATSFSSF